MPQSSSEAKNVAERNRIAGVLADLLRQNYSEGVEVLARGWTVTISRGKPAVQIQVLDIDRFLVAVRRNQTFHMQPDPVDRKTMAGLIDQMIGAPAAHQAPAV